MIVVRIPGANRTGFSGCSRCTGYILDEPELGLHPFALQVLAELMHKAAQDRQLIVATQSVSLINYFQPEDLLITERGENGATQFRRLKDKDFESWLEEYSLGQLWERNILSCYPRALRPV